MTHRNDLIPSDHADITPSDSGNLGLIGLVVGTGGTLRVVSAKGTTANYKAADGFVLTLAISRVMAAGTTATDIVGFLP